MNNRNENKTAGTAAENVQLIQCEITADMTVRIFTKKREKGAIKFSKKRLSRTFENAVAANDFVANLMKSGNKIRKIEVSSPETGLLTFKPVRDRKTPTAEERQAIRDEKAAEREKAKAAKAAEREKDKAAKAAEREKAKKAKEADKAKAAKNEASEKQAQKVQDAKKKLSEKTLA